MFTYQIHLLFLHYLSFKQLLSSTEDIARQWKGHFEELLNPTVMSSIKEAVPGEEYGCLAYHCD